MKDEGIRENGQRCVNEWICESDFVVAKDLLGELGSYVMDWTVCSTSHNLRQPKSYSIISQWPPLSPSTRRMMPFFCKFEVCFSTFRSEVCTSLAISGIEISGLILINSTIFPAVFPIRFPLLFPRTFSPNFHCLGLCQSSVIRTCQDTSYRTYSNVGKSVQSHLRSVVSTSAVCSCRSLRFPRYASRGTSLR